MSQFADSLNLGLSFVVKNTAPQGKSLKVFNNAIPNGMTIDLAKIPGISVDDIKASLLKGEIGLKLKSKYLTFVSTTIDFGSDHADGTYAGLLTSLGITTVPRKTSQTTWYVSPATGSDLNTGLSGSPLKTLRELGRRLSSDLPRDLTTVNVLDNVTDANDFLQIMARLDPQGALNPSPVVVTGGTGPIAPISLKIKGTRTTASFTDPSTSSTTALTTTAATTAPQAIATTVAAGSNGAALPQGTVNVVSTTGMPTSGRFMIETTVGTVVTCSVVSYTGITATSFTGCTGGTGTMATGDKVVVELPGIISVSGFDFTPHIGRFIEFLTASPSGAVGLTCGIVAAPSSGVAWVTPINNVATHANLASGSYPTTGATFRIYTVTTWAPHMSPGVIPGVQINYEDMEFTTATAQWFSTDSVAFEGCVLRRAFRASASGEAQINFNGSLIVFAAPPIGRSPTQIAHTNGEIRFLTCGFVNVDIRAREGTARVLLGSCIAVGSCFNFGGPNDAGRMGSNASAFQGFLSNMFGVGIYDWPGPDLLAPSPAMTRGSTGAAITMGHRAQVAYATRMYGNCVTANTTFWRVRESATLLIADNMTDEVSPVNPTSPGAPYVALSLGGAGTLGQIFLDEPPATNGALPQTAIVAPTQISEANKRGVFDGSVAPGVSNFEPLTAWKEWRTRFLRNVVGLRTGAAIINLAT